ncbi:MAG: hypothetical protein AB7G17_08910 [Phycisphaerales bacterium]
MTPKPAIIAATLFATLGAGALVYSTVSNSKTHQPRPASAIDNPRTRAPGPRSPNSPPPDASTPDSPDIAATPAPKDPPPNFPPASTPEQLDTILSSLESHVAQLAPANTDVSALGVDASSKLAPAARAVLDPFFHASSNKLIDMVRSLGGTPPEVTANAGNPPGSRLFSLLQGASIDFTRAELVPRVINGRDLEREEMNARLSQQGAVGASGKPIPGTNAAQPANTDPNAQRETRRESVMKMVPGNLFPDVQNPADKKLNVIEVRAPVLFSGEQPTSTPAKLGVQLAWNPAVKNWQIVAFQLYGADPSTISSRMRPQQ